MLHIATALWDANSKSLEFSRCYDESWVLKLYWGFKRNLTVPFKFVVFTDRPRDILTPDIVQMMMLGSAEPDYGSFTEPYSLNEPMILVGLDTVVAGNVDHLAAHCLGGDKIALPRDPYAKWRACNGVALVPAGQRGVYDRWQGENDMDWIRLQPHEFIDDLFPGQVLSYKGDVVYGGLNDARIVYFHGVPKPHELPGADWIQKHWRIGQ